MKYFIDTHDKSKGSFPEQELTEQEFFKNFDALEKPPSPTRRFRSRRACEFEGRQGLLLHVRTR